MKRADYHKIEVGSKVKLLRRGPLYGAVAEVCYIDLNCKNPMVVKVYVPELYKRWVDGELVTEGSDDLVFAHPHYVELLD